MGECPGRLGAVDVAVHHAMNVDRSGRTGGKPAARSQQNGTAWRRALVTLAMVAPSSTAFNRFDERNQVQDLGATFNRM